MTRRDFGKRISGLMAALLVLGSGAMLEGCNAISDLKAWIPVALSAVNGIVKVLGSLVSPQIQAMITTIDAALNAVLTAIANYQGGKGVIGDIENAIAAVESAFQSFFAFLNVSSTLLSTIEGLAQIILSTIAAFANDIQPSGVATGKTFKLGGQTIPYGPHKRNVKTFRSDWNSFCESSGHTEGEI